MITEAHSLKHCVCANSIHLFIIVSLQVLFYLSFHYQRELVFLTSLILEHEDSRRT